MRQENEKSKPVDRGSEGPVERSEIRLSFVRVSGIGLSLLIGRV